MRERGVRITLQRAYTWRVLAESEEHLTTEEVWEQAREALPGLELSTVYRLEALRTAGLVPDSHLPGEPRVFEARSASHPHLVCEGCGEIPHPDSGVGRWLLEALNAGSGSFEMRELRVVACGTCARCAGRGEGKAAGSSGFEA